MTLAPELSAALVERLTAFADDELVLGHHQAAWTGHAPLLEEDIAIANVAQDEIGHAVAWLELRAALDGSDPDRLVFFRAASDYRSAWLSEQPRGDWAFTMLRQYLFDAYEAELLARLSASSYRPLADTAAKVAREELFHLRHSRLWVERLAHGTDESRDRLVSAIAVAWPLMAQLLAPLPQDAALEAAGITYSSRDLEESVVAATSAELVRHGFALPPFAPVPAGDPRALRTEHLAPTLLVMQSVARSDADAQAW